MTQRKFADATGGVCPDGVEVAQQGRFEWIATRRKIGDDAFARLFGVTVRRFGALHRCALVHRYGLRLAVYRATARKDHVGRAVPFGCFEDVHRAGDVVRIVLER